MSNGPWAYKTNAKIAEIGFSTPIMHEVCILFHHQIFLSVRDLLSITYYHAIPSEYLFHDHQMLFFFTLVQMFYLFQISTKAGSDICFPIVHL